VSDSVKSDDIAYTKNQLECFFVFFESIKTAGIVPGIVHAANTGGVAFHNDSWFDMVRPGILLYGYSPHDQEGKAAIAVKPLMELQSAITFIKKIKKGQSISYGRTWAAGEDTLVGTIPLGYGDGLSRLLSNNWQIALGIKNQGKEIDKENENRGEMRPLVGRICMDQCMVNLGADSTVRRWDPVTVFGGVAPDAGKMALTLNTIPYEITCNINKRVPRVFFE
jgi:alanine racemase